MRRVKLMIIVAALLSCKFVLAQHTYSPFTVVGIGELNGMGMSHNTAMGGVGIANPTVWHINLMNPALLPYNSLTVFEIGVEGENRKISNNLGKVKVGTAGFKYLNFAFPIIPAKWTSSIGLMPYSTVNYSFTVTSDIAGTVTDSQVLFEGIGGLNQVFFSNGVNVFEGFNVGLRMSYIFGLIEETTNTQLIGGNLSQQFPTGYLSKTDYNGFNFGFGMAYKKVLNENNNLNFGLTFDLASEINGSRFERNQYLNALGNIVPGDTIVTNLTDQFKLPSEIGFGVSWRKINKMNIGLDIKRSIWNENAGFGNDAETFVSTWSIGLGMELTPKYNDVNNYLKRIKYRLGLEFKQLPYEVNNNTINDFGINFGTSLPIKGVSALNLSFKYGQRGTIAQTLVKEQYLKFVLGATINDRWFVRRKYN